jgi:hypothetical protein
MISKKIILITLLVLAGICNFLFIAYFFYKNSYLPAPFIPDKNDTFMDFFHTLYWSQNDGIYTEWKSLYPPLNFLILDFFYEFFIGDLNGTPFEYRKQSLSKLFGIGVIFASCLLVSIKISYSKLVNLKYQLLLFFLFLLSPPFLFALERGNLLILCLPLLSLYILPLKNIYKSLILSLLVNLKPYFLILYIVIFINSKINNKNNDLIILMPIFSLIIFLSTGLILNQEFYLLPFNLFDFSNAGALSPYNILTFPSSISSFIFLNEIIPDFKISRYLGYTLKILLFYFIFKLIQLVFRKKLTMDYLTIIGVVIITNYSITSGGYSLLFYIPILAIFYKNKNYAFLAIISIFFLGVIGIIPIYYTHNAIGMSYLSSAPVEIVQNLTLIAVIYPVANFIVLVMLYNYLKIKVNHDQPQAKT